MPEPTPVSPTEVAARWPVPGPLDDKYSRGVLGIVAGSDEYPGAAVLAVAGAVRSGLGLVHYVGSRRAGDLVLTHRPEAVVHDVWAIDGSLPRATAWLVGPGLTTADAELPIARDVIASGLPLVADAGAIVPVARALIGFPAAGRRAVLLTPHEAELAAALTATGRDVGRVEVSANRANSAAALSQATGATVLLKGSRTLIAHPGSPILELPEATPWLATAGAGDVLAGVAGALVAQGMETRWAGAAAALIHAQAASLASAGGPISALDVADSLPKAIAALLTERPRWGV